MAFFLPNYWQNITPFELEDGVVMENLPASLKELSVMSGQEESQGEILQMTDRWSVSSQ